MTLKELIILNLLKSHLILYSLTVGDASRRRTELIMLICPGGTLCPRQTQTFTWSSSLLSLACQYNTLLFIWSVIYLYIYMKIIWQWFGNNYCCLSSHITLSKTSQRNNPQKIRQSYCLNTHFCIFPTRSACLWSVGYCSCFTDMHKAQNCSFHNVSIDFSIVTPMLKTGNPKTKHIEYE